MFLDLLNELPNWSDQVIFSMREGVHHSILAEDVGELTTSSD